MDLIWGFNGDLIWLIMVNNGKPTEFLVFVVHHFLPNFEGDRTRWQNEF